MAITTAIRGEVKGNSQVPSCRLPAQRLQVKSRSKHRNALSSKRISSEARR